MDVNKQNNITFDKICTVIVVLSPVFLQYIVFTDFLILSEFFLLLVLCTAFLKSKVIYVSKYFRPLFLFLFLSFLFSCFAALVYEHFSFYSFLSTYFRYFFYILIIVFVCDKHFLYFFGLRIFLVISGALSIYGLMQYVYFMFSGIALPWYLPFLEIKYGNELIENSSYYFSEFGYRFSSLFSEPAHFSQYIGLALLLLVLQEKVIFSKRFDSSLMFLLAISLLLSASGTGFALLILVFIAFTKVRILQNKSILGLLFFIYISIPAIAFVLLNFSTGFERMTSFSDVSSIYIRVIRPYSVYFDMPVLQMIFGVGYGNYSEYVLSLNTLTAFELERNITWANSGAFLLVGVGGFALLPYLYFHYSISRKCIISMFTTLFIVLHLIYSDLPLSIFYILSIAFVLSVGKSGESFHKD